MLNRSKSVLELAQEYTPTGLWELLNHPKLTDLCLNGSASGAMDLGKGLEAVEPYFEGSRLPFEDSQLRDWVLQLLSLSGRTWDARAPYFDFTLSNRFRFHVICPPLSPQGWVVSIRRLAAPSLDSGHSYWKNIQGFEIIETAFRRGESVLICGSTASGKTTFAAELLRGLPPGSRTLILEDTLELALNQPQAINLIARSANADGCGEVPLRALLRQALRMRPDRIVLGECRGAEVFELLQALNTGHSGTLATLHSDSARGACRRIELLCRLSPEARYLSEKTLREWIAAGIQWIVHLERGAFSERRISEICRVEGIEGDTLVLRPMLRPSL